MSEAEKQGPKFTDSERACIRRNVREKLKEGIPMPVALAASISICAPDKAKKHTEKSLTDAWWS